MRLSADSAPTAQAGRIVFFEHDLFHSGAPLRHGDRDPPREKGQKYVVRTDVMFKTPSYMATSAAPTPVPAVGTAAGAGDGASGDDVSIARMLRRLGLGHLEGTLDECGLLTSIEAFRTPGVVIVRAVLLDLEIGEPEVQQIVSAAFAS